MNYNNKYNYDESRMEKLDHWKKRPTIIEYWDDKVDSILAIDENGTIDLNGVRKNLIKIYTDDSHNDRWFTITAVEINREDFSNFRDSINSIKYGHWKDGCFDYKKGNKRVVFHSREIRKKTGPFNPKIINYSELINDINSLIANTPFRIYSSSIDKAKHILQYANPYPVYNLCLEFIIERHCRNLNRNGKKGIILLEARGKNEDRIILEYLVDLFKKGNRYNGPEFFSCIEGVYFNPKWSKTDFEKKSFVLLELADLVSYPIHKFAKLSKKDQAYLVLESKIYNYPYVDGYGLKLFP